MCSRRTVFFLAGASVLFILFASGTTQSAPPPAVDAAAAKAVLASYGVATQWPDRSLGNHRARLRLSATGDVAWARVEWRLPGLPMQERQQLVLVDEETGSTVRSLLVVSASWEAAEVLFEPTVQSGATRHYLLYYLAFNDAPCVTGPASACTSGLSQLPYCPRTALRHFLHSSTKFLEACVVLPRTL